MHAGHFETTEGVTIQISALRNIVILRNLTFASPAKISASKITRYTVLRNTLYGSIVFISQILNTY